MLKHVINQRSMGKVICSETLTFGGRAARDGLNRNDAIFEPQGRVFDNFEVELRDDNIIKKARFPFKFSVVKSQSGISSSPLPATVAKW